MCLPTEVQTVWNATVHMSQSHPQTLRNFQHTVVGIMLLTISLQSSQELSVLR